MDTGIVMMMKVEKRCKLSTDGVFSQYRRRGLAGMEEGVNLQSEWQLCVDLRTPIMMKE